MLGSVESSKAWHWAARGKHPVARDYFCLGRNSPLIKAFSDWIEKGYEALHAKQGVSSLFFSWRFWAKGPKKGTLVCGLGRDSSDSLGRPYPLLIVGTGPLQGWLDQWDLLPFVCEKTWSQMEHMSTKRFSDLKELEDEVSLIRPPFPHWSEFASQRGDLDMSSWNPGLFESKAACLSTERNFVVPLEGGPPNDYLATASLWHLFLKAQSRVIPNAVFMGGVPDESYLAVFKGPLAPSDFVLLWSGLRAT